MRNNILSIDYTVQLGWNFRMYQQYKDSIHVKTHIFEFNAHSQRLWWNIKLKLNSLTSKISADRIQQSLSQRETIIKIAHVCISHKTRRYIQIFIKMLSRCLVNVHNSSVVKLSCQWDANFGFEFPKLIAQCKRFLIV